MNTVLQAARAVCQHCGHPWYIRKDKVPARCPSCHKRHPVGGTSVAADHTSGTRKGG